jgi:hypothetical protein
MQEENAEFNLTSAHIKMFANILFFLNRRQSAPRRK